MKFMLTFLFCFVAFAPITNAQRNLDTRQATVEKRNAQGLTEAEVAYNDGTARQAAGDIESAITAYTRALELDPYFPAAHNNRGQARLKKGDAQGAIEDFSEAIKYRTQSPDGYYNRGNAYLAAGKYAEAIADFTRAAELNPRDAQPFNNRANAYRESKRPKEAIADYTRAIEIAPRADFFYNRAVAHEDAGMMENALTDYTEAIKRNQEDAQAYANRGILFLRANRDAEADADFANAFRLDPALRVNLEEYIKSVRAARPRKP